jgi:hypothetical protein
MVSSLLFALLGPQRIDQAKYNKRWLFYQVLGRLSG